MKTKLNLDEKVIYGTLHFAFLPRTIEVWENSYPNIYTVFLSFYWSTEAVTKLEGIGSGVEFQYFKKPKFDLYHFGPNLLDLLSTTPYWFVIGLIYEIFK